MGLSIEARYQLDMTLLPDDDDADDIAWQHYCHEAAQVAPVRVLECVLSDLDGEESPLLPYILDVLKHPFRPGEPVKTNQQELIALGQLMLVAMAHAADGQVNLRMAC